MVNIHENKHVKYFLIKSYVDSYADFQQKGVFIFKLFWYVYVTFLIIAINHKKRVL